MPTMKQIIFVFVLVFALLATATAQDSTSASAQRSTLTITAAASGERVRITAPSTVVQMHVEVYAPNGQKLFDQEIRGGNVFDWHLQDGQAQRLAPGAYVCVVTAKSVSGKLTQKIGTVTVAENSASVQPAEALSALQVQTIGPVEADSSWTIPGNDEPQTPTVIANDGKDGQMIRGRGALTFRIGNFFSGLDQEQMRLTEAGDLGLGTAEPKAKLDVAGTIRAERFLVAKPKPGGGDKTGTLAADSGDSFQPLTSGTGTPNQIAKWILADTLGDSGITETGGNIGINTTAPDGKLSVVTAPNTYALRTSGGNLETYLQHGAGAGTWFTNSTGGFIINNQAGPLAFSANNIEYMRILNTGLVGIGTAAPGGRLHIGTAPNTYALRTSGGNLETYLQHGAGAGTWFTNSSGGFTINNQAGPLAFSANNVEAFRITSTGDVGFGTGAPNGKLHIATLPNTYALRTSGGNLETYLQHGATSGTWFTNSSGGFTINNQAGPLAFSANNAEVMRFSNTGNVGIGTTTPAAKLDIQGGADHDGSTDVAPAMAFQWRGGGYRHWIRTRHNGIPGSGNAIDFFVNDSTTGIGSSGPGSGSAFVMTLDSGRVGIGTETPLARLQVVTSNDANPLFIAAWDSRHFVIGGPASSGGIGMSYDQTNNVGYITSLSPNVAFRNLALQAVGGNVGIGTASPNARLQVAGGDIAITQQLSGLILRANNGTNCFRLLVNNTGQLGTEAVTCP
jgi:hypothetical protein